MKRIDRPNGYFSTYDPSTGARVEGETRQCVHCQHTWIYNPKDSFNRVLSGLPRVTRGICTRCHGLVCGLPACQKVGCVHFAKKIELAEKLARERGSLIITEP